MYKKLLINIGGAKSVKALIVNFFFICKKFGFILQNLHTLMSYNAFTVGTIP